MARTAPHKATASKAAPPIDRKTTMGRAFSYLRVSTADQDLEKFKTKVLHYANEKGLGQVHFVEDTVSGTTSWRKRKVAKLIETLDNRDRLIVPELSRLGRSTVEVLEIVNIANQKKFEIHSLKPMFIVDDSMQGKIMATMFALMAELERDLISIRTKEALQARKKAGVRLGRPKGPGKSKLDPFKDEIVALLRNGSSKSYVAQRYNTSPVNLYHWIKKRNLDVKPIIRQTL